MSFQAYDLHLHAQVMRFRFALPLLVAAGLVACSDESLAVHEPTADVVESKPGALVITEPHRAAFLEQASADDLVTIKGTGATKALTVAGMPADVASDGTFTAKIHATPGLNIVAAVDGDARLETSFLWGHFLPPTLPIAHAIAVDLGSRGISGVLPDASLESVANLALQDRDLLYRLEGKSFSGKNAGVDWTFTVTKGENGAAGVVLKSADKGVNISASIQDVLVEGVLSMKTGVGLEYVRDVKINVAKGTVAGDVSLGIDTDKSALTAAMPNAEAKIEGFKFDTDNAGFPCCVDSIITGVVQWKINDALGEAIRTKVPELVQVTLDGMGVPKKIDFAAKGVSLKMPIATKFDGGSFDRDGGTITASTFFGADPKPGIPGFIGLGLPYGGAPTRSSALGVSVSIDALNQLMYAAWADGSLTYEAPAPLAATLSVGLPPVIAITPDGAVRVGVGEVLVQRKGADHALAAVSVQQDVVPSAANSAIVLTPKGKPTVSVTWLADDSAGSGLNLVANAAQDQLGAILKPFAFRIPAVALDSLGGALMGHALVVDQPAITVDAKTMRIGAAGNLKLIQ